MDTNSMLTEARLQRVSDGVTHSLFATCDSARHTLLLIWPQLGDFDTLEYAWWLERERSQLKSANIDVRAVGIGDRTAGEKFCRYTHFPAQHLYIDPTASLHQLLNLYKGLTASLPITTPQQNGYLNPD